MKKYLLAMAAMAILAAGGAVAEAGHGHGGGGYSYNRGFYGGYAPRVSFYGGGRNLPGVYYGRGGGGHHGHWHDTSHYDFHSGGYERHYDHYHYVPSHYDWHQDGHWDHH